MVDQSGPTKAGATGILPDQFGLGPVAPTASARAVLRPLPRAWETASGLLAARQVVNREVSLPFGRERLEAAGNFDNFRMAAGGDGAFRGQVFNDSDVYKWAEALAWEQQRRPDRQLARYQQEVNALVSAAQQADGYLDTYYQLTGEPRFVNLATGHELYCAGHLVQAAVAQQRATGDQALLGVAQRTGKLLVNTFSAPTSSAVPGHPLIETALVELYRSTGDQAYLSLASQFIDRRGRRALPTVVRFTSSYLQDDVPLREATSLSGHAVRAMYLATGATDVAAETSDRDLDKALGKQWASVMSTKAYLTGGLGSRWAGEQIGDAYELPADLAYCETCAAIGSIQWAWRMLLATGEAVYADQMERTLFNGFLAGVSLDGQRFSYVNPLQVRTRSVPVSNRSAILGRQPWFDTACCPANVMRTLSSLDHYFLTGQGNGLQLHLYADGHLQASLAPGRVRLRVTTAYPWQEDIEVEVLETPSGPWELALRFPAWCESPTASVNGTELAGMGAPGSYGRVKRCWAAGDRVVLHLPMPIRLTHPHPRVDALRGCVAFERGPLVYCFEQVDLPSGAAVAMEDIAWAPGSKARLAPADGLEAPAQAIVAPVVALGHQLEQPEGRAPAPWPSPRSPAGGELRTFELRATPYFAWGNREVGAMRVWVPVLASA